MRTAQSLSRACTQCPTNFKCSSLIGMALVLAMPISQSVPKHRPNDLPALISQVPPLFRALGGDKETGFVKPQRRCCCSLPKKRVGNYTMIFTMIHHDLVGIDISDLVHLRRASYSSPPRKQVQRLASGRSPPSTDPLSEEAAVLILSFSLPSFAICLIHIVSALFHGSESTTEALPAREHSHTSKLQIYTVSI